MTLQIINLSVLMCLCNWYQRIIIYSIIYLIIIIILQTQLSLHVLVVYSEYCVEMGVLSE